MPNTYTSTNETGCCAVPNISDWQDAQIEFINERFIILHTKSFLYMPLNMAKIMKKLDRAASEANAKPPMEQAMILSRDISPWQAEQCYRVTMPIQGQDNIVLNGSFLSKVFEGPYQNAKKWYNEMLSYAAEQGSAAKRVYFFYTTCPKCAKHYGKNYVIGLAEVQI